MLKKIILWIFIVLVVLLVVLAVTINPLLSWSSGKAFNKFAPQMTGTAAQVEAVEVSVYQGRIEIDSLFIGNPPGFSSDRALSLDKMVLEVAPSSLLGSTLRVEEIAINNPTIIIEHANGKTNLLEIKNNLARQRPAPAQTDEKDEDAKPAKAKGEPRKLSVNKVELTDADVQVVVGNQSFTVQVPDILLENVAPDGVTPSELSMRILEQLLGQIKFDAGQLPAQIGEQLSSEFEEHLQQATEQGRGLLKQLEQESGVQTEALRNLLGR